MKVRDLLYRGEMVAVPAKVIIKGYPPVMDSRIISLKKQKARNSQPAKSKGKNKQQKLKKQSSCRKKRKKERIRLKKQGAKNNSEETILGEVIVVSIIFLIICLTGLLFID